MFSLMQERFRMWVEKTLFMLYADRAKRFNTLLEAQEAYGEKFWITKLNIDSLAGFTDENKEIVYVIPYTNDDDCLHLISSGRVSAVNISQGKANVVTLHELFYMLEGMDSLAYKKYVEDPMFKSVFVTVDTATGKPIWNEETGFFEIAIVGEEFKHHVLSALKYMAYRVNENANSIHLRDELAKLRLDLHDVANEKTEYITKDLRDAGNTLREFGNTLRDIKSKVERTM